MSLYLLPPLSQGGEKFDINLVGTYLVCVRRRSRRCVISRSYRRHRRRHRRIITTTRIALYSNLQFF